MVNPRGSIKPNVAGFRRNQRLLVADAFAIFACTRVDFDHVADLDKARHHEFRPGLNLRRFGDVGSGIAFGTWNRVYYFKFNVRRWLKRDRDVIEQRHRACHAILEILPRIACHIGRNFVLFEVRGIHENVCFTLSVKELNVGLLHVRAFERIAALVGSVEHRTANKILHPALVECVALTGFDEVHLNHKVRFAVDLDLETFAKIACVVCCHDLAGSVSILKNRGMFWTVRRRF